MTAGLLASALVLPALPAAAAPARAPHQAATGWRVSQHVPQRPVLRRAAGGGRTLVAAVTRPTAAGAGLRPAVTGARSTWQVRYTGFSAVQQAAFQRAVDVWARLVASTVPITVDANLSALPPGVLGQAGAQTYAANSSNVYYPIALANSLAGRDIDPSPNPTTDPLDPAHVDIGASFSNNTAGAYYGADPAAIPAGSYDFTTVVLHELGHGLGFIGSALKDSTGTLSYGVDSAADPLVFDLFTQSADTFAVLDRVNSSAALAAALQSSSGLFFSGDQATGVTAAGPPRLYAPSTWEPGSSYSHLDEASYPQGNANSLMTPALGNAEVIRDPGDITLGIFADMGWDVPPLPGSRFTPVAPVRVLETRSGLGVPGGASVKVGPGATVDLTVAGHNGVPADARAVVLNLTADHPSAPTDVRAYPTPRAGALYPGVSNLNVSTGEQRANAVTVRVGSGGRVRFRNTAGSVYLIADLAGFYAPAGQSTYHPVTPSRILDTNAGTGVPLRKLGPGGTVDLTVTGGSVPAGATAAVLSLTVVHATTQTDVRAYPTPADASFPRVSSVNVAPGRTTPNLVVVALSGTGRVRIRNTAGSVDLRGDLAGWFGTAAAGGQYFHAVTPQRVFDTRPQPLAAGGVRDLLLAGDWFPSRAAAAVLNVTGVSATATTDVRAYPVSSTVPNTSILNVVPARTVADLTYVTLSSGGAVRFRNTAGSIELLADAAGWFGLV